MKYWNITVNTELVSSYFAAEKDYRDKGRFLYGESMGGAVALLLHKKEPLFYNGAVLVAPMCKVFNSCVPR